MVSSYLRWSADTYFSIVDVMGILTWRHGELFNKSYLLVLLRFHGGEEDPVWQSMCADTGFRPFSDPSYVNASLFLNHTCFAWG